MDFLLSRLRDPYPRLERTLRQRLGDAWSRRRGLPVVYHYPESVQIVPTNACNYRCQACPKSLYDTDNRSLDPQVYRRVRARLLPHARSAALQGLGEPMLSPLFFAMLDDARRFGLKISFTTNASRITGENARRIVSSPAVMIVSIDGACAETHEDSRRGAKFSQLLEALGEIKRRIETPEAHPDFELHVNTVLTRRNLDEVPRILELAAGCRARRLTLIAPGVGERDDAFARDAIGRHEELFVGHAPSIAAHARGLGIEVCFPPYVAAALLTPPAGDGVGGGSCEPAPQPQPRQGGEAAGLFPQRCPDPWKTVYVDVDGWVRPCCRAIWIGMGNVLKQDFWDIWNGEHYLRLRQTIHTDAPPDFCRGCTLPWGITAGDPDYEQKLAARGVALGPPPRIGLSWDKKRAKTVRA